MLLPRPSDDAIYKALPDGAVLFHAQDEVYFGLNVVGAQVWEALPPETRTLEQLCSLLERSYPDVDPATIRTDVLELLQALATNHLVEAIPTEEPSESALAS